jgi:lipopolysaccharide/colanic/teichoic acid biosynthesis glycosyltransferase
MKSAYDSEGRHIPDNERTSAIGRFIRHTRLDELPQLFHILFGQMSFIGPRPLLPIDQADEHSARLAVRPGLTGWAQVNGGREVSIADKAAMDIWYVHNASFALDIKIAISTVYTIVFGERPNPNAIKEAWLYLRNATISEVAAGPVDGPPETERWVA